MSRGRVAMIAWAVGMEDPLIPSDLGVKEEPWDQLTASGLSIESGVYFIRLWQGYFGRCTSHADRGAIYKAESNNGYICDQHFCMICEYTYTI